MTPNDVWWTQVALGVVCGAVTLQLVVMFLVAVMVFRTFHHVYVTQRQIGLMLRGMDRDQGRQEQ